MATYAIGDVQGCFDELQLLLRKINFNEEKDELYFVGDLVNRGPKSLDVLRFIKNLPNKQVVLGNHDFHLLALCNGQQHPHHTMHEILDAPDRDEITNWLKKQPLMYFNAEKNFVLVHAGIYPSWNIHEAQQYAKEVKAGLDNEDLTLFFQNIYGNKPNQWSEDLAGWERIRFIVNAFTRMRFCTPQGKLDFHHRGEMTSAPNGYLPWFKISDRATKENNIIFGHWAALDGVTNEPNVFALDTGCAWGRCLTAMCLETQQRWSVDCK